MYNRSFVLKRWKFLKENFFHAPPREWINHRLDRLHETLSKNTVQATTALKELLGNIELEPVAEEDRPKPYYLAHTKIQTLALLDEEHQGSNWLQMRRG